MFIRSERLFLRPGWPEDRDEMLRCMEHGTAPAYPAAWNMAGEAAPDASRRHPQFLVTLPGAHGARLVGCVGLTRAAPGIAAHAAPVEFACWIAEEFRGRGFGAEAGRATLAVARTLGHRRIGAALPAATPAALRMLDQLGFRPVPQETGWRGAIAPSSGWLRDLGPQSDCDEYRCEHRPIAAA